MFLKRAISQTLDSKPIPQPLDLTWDTEDTYCHLTNTYLKPEQFNWYLIDFALEDIGSPDFIDYLTSWMDCQMDFDHPVAGDDWHEIWQCLKDGKEITRPVEIALTYQPDYEEERVLITDGWHRISLYVRAGRTTIPAFVGVPKNAMTLRTKGI